MDGELVPLLLLAGTVVCGSMVVMQLLLRIDIKGSRRKKTNVRNGREALLQELGLGRFRAPPWGVGGTLGGSSGQGLARGLCLQWLDGERV